MRTITTLKIIICFDFFTFWSWRDFMVLKKTVSTKNVTTVRLYWIASVFHANWTVIIVIWRTDTAYNTILQDVCIFRILNWVGSRTTLCTYDIDTLKFYLPCVFIGWVFWIELDLLLTSSVLFRQILHILISCFNYDYKSILLY